MNEQFRSIGSTHTFTKFYTVSLGTLGLAQKDKTTAVTAILDTC